MKKNKHCRTLKNIDLYNEKCIYPGLFYAVDKSGWGRIYTPDEFLGLAMPKHIMPPFKYKVTLWGKLSPDRNFVRRKYNTQATANRWLIIHAKRLAGLHGFVL